MCCSASQRWRETHAALPKKTHSRSCFTPQLRTQKWAKPLRFRARYFWRLPWASMPAGRQRLGWLGAWLALGCGRYWGRLCWVRASRRLEPMPVSLSLVTAPAGKAFLLCP